MYNFVFATYDEDGNFIETTAYSYYVTTNAQGDVLGIYTAAGVQVAAYEYDAWGNCTVYDVTQDSDGNNVFTKVTYSESQKFNMEFLNPFRYRGYYYDQDMGLYYLQSRYYDQMIGRFISADTQINSDILGCSLFTYCGNNPITRKDSTGYSFVTAVIITLVVSVVVTKVVCTVKEAKRIDKELRNLPKPKKDISGSFGKTLRNNANTIKETKKKDGFIAASKQFYNNVRNKGEWDLKQKTEYQGAFLFNDIVVEAQDIGNINFGYTGKALGLSDDVLLTGAGVAQIMAGTSCFSYVMVSSGDDLRDQMYIMYGIMLYNEDNK